MPPSSVTNVSKSSCKKTVLPPKVHSPTKLATTRNNLFVPTLPRGELYKYNETLCPWAVDPEFVRRVVCEKISKGIYRTWFKCYDGKTFINLEGTNCTYEETFSYDD